MIDFLIMKDFATNLIAGIVDRACEDYKIALKDGYSDMAEELEGFFLSPEGQIFTRGYGQRIIERLRKEVKENDSGRSNEASKNEKRNVNSRARRKNRYFRVFNTRVRKRQARC